MSFDFLIVGNAILGLTTAYRLTQLAPHAKIGIIGPSHRGGSATTAAGAMLGLFGEITTTYYTDHYNKAYFALARYAQTEWPQLVAELNQQLPTKEHIAIHPNGTFVLLKAPSPEQDDALNYQAIVGNGKIATAFSFIFQYSEIKDKSYDSNSSPLPSLSKYPIKEEWENCWRQAKILLSCLW